MAKLLSQQWSSPGHPSIGKLLLDPLFQQVLPTGDTFLDFSPPFSSFLQNLQKSGEEGENIQTRRQSDVPGLQLSEVTLQISSKNRESRANSLAGGWEIIMKNTKSSARICVPRKEPCGPHSQSPRFHQRAFLSDQS